ncbi:hypothetical protein K2X30_13385 [bacterium]|nr:hypothetical protein [bacterium]
MDIAFQNQKKYEGVHQPMIDMPGNRLVLHDDFGMPNGEKVFNRNLYDLFGKRTDLGHGAILIGLSNKTQKKYKRLLEQFADASFPKNPVPTQTMKGADYFVFSNNGKVLDYSLLFMAFYGDTDIASFIANGLSGLTSVFDLPILNKQGAFQDIEMFREVGDADGSFWFNFASDNLPAVLGAIVSYKGNPSVGRGYSTFAKRRDRTPKPEGFFGVYKPDELPFEPANDPDAIVQGYNCLDFVYTVAQASGAISPREAHDIKAEILFPKEPLDLSRKLPLGATGLTLESWLNSYKPNALMMAAAMPDLSSGSLQLFDLPQLARGVIEQSMRTGLVPPFGRINVFDQTKGIRFLREKVERNRAQGRTGSSGYPALSVREELYSLRKMAEKNILPTTIGPQSRYDTADSAGFLSSPEYREYLAEAEHLRKVGIRNLGGNYKTPSGETVYLSGEAVLAKFKEIQDAAAKQIGHIDR